MGDLSPNWDSLISDYKLTHCFGYGFVEGMFRGHSAEIRAVVVHIIERNLKSPLFDRSYANNHLDIERYIMEDIDGVHP